MTELKELTFSLIRNSLFNVGGAERGHHNLICDSTTLRILGSVCRMSDLYELGVTSIEDIANERRATPDLDALYFLSVDKASVRMLTSDYEKKPQHAGVHLVFCEAVSVHVFKELAEHKGLAPRVKSFKEANINFAVFQEDAFHLARPNVVQFFNSTSAIQICADGILSICNVLTVRPTIRYAKTGCCPDVAKMVYENHKQSAIPTRMHSTLLIVDRTVDIQAALLHESTYEALIYDVVPGFDHESDTITVGGKQQLVHDTYFNKLKYLHFLDVEKKVQADIQAFSKKNANLTKVQRGDAGDVGNQDLISAIRKLPEYQEQFRSFDNNLPLLRMIKEELESRNIIVPRRADNKIVQNAGSFESELATGITDSMKEAKLIGMTSALTTFFRSGPAISSEIKCRLVLLFLALFNEVTAHARRSLIDSAELSDEDRLAVQKFIEIGLGGEDWIGKSELKRSKSQLNLAKKNLKDQTNIIARFTPRLKTLMERLIDNLLETDNFPGFSVDKVPVHAANEGRNWGWKNINATGSDAKSKLIVFVIGGVTLSEIRVAQELAEMQKKCDILIGGTCILTPKTLLSSLRGQHGTNPAEVEIDLR